MAITIVATAGDAGANSYITLADAESYMETRLHASAWTSASADEKMAGLVWATRLLDQYRWKGEKTTSTGALTWPRTGVYNLDDILLDGTTVPAFLANATAEMALHLLVSDRTADKDNAGIKSVKVDVVSVDFDASTTQRTLAPSVHAMIKPYLVHGSAYVVDLVRA